MGSLTSGDLSSGASVATGYSTQSGITVTRADIVSPARIHKLNNVETAASASTYAFPRDLGPHYINITIKEAKTTPTIGGVVSQRNAILNTKNYIRLPLPDSLRDVNEVMYTEEGAISASSITGVLTNLLTSAAGLRAGSVSGGLGDVGALAEAKARTGLAPNQMLTVLLKGPKYKTHTLSWKLYPRNAGESATLKYIIESLKTSSRPGLAGSRSFFTFPNIFEISFSNPGYLFHFKPAVLESVVVNYTPSGQPNLYRETAAPDGIELSLTFLELEYWMSGEEENFWTETAPNRLAPAAVDAASDFVADPIKNYIIDPLSSFFGS